MSLDANLEEQTGYLRHPDGTSTKLDPPGAAENKALGVNERGQVVGVYLDDGVVANADGLYPPGTIHGYMWDNGRYTRLDVPGSGATSAVKIDRRGRIVGEVKDAAGAIHGFLLERGRYTVLDHPAQHDRQHRPRHHGARRDPAPVAGDVRRRRQRRLSRCWPASLPVGFADSPRSCTRCCPPAARPSARREPPASAHGLAS